MFEVSSVVRPSPDAWRMAFKIGTDRLVNGGEVAVRVVDILMRRHVTIPQFGSLVKRIFNGVAERGESITPPVALDCRDLV